jgi:peptidoglycan lytic transglycosylase G
MEAAKRILATRRAGATPKHGGPGRLPPAPGGGGPGQVSRRTGGLGRFLPFALLGAAVALVIVFLALVYQPGKGPGGDEVRVNVPEGAGVGEIGDILAEHGVISRPVLFEVRATLDGKRSDLRSGDYRLREDMSYGAVLAALSQPPEPPVKKNEPVTITIPEGKARTEIAPIVEDAGLKGDYLDASVKAKGFNPKKYKAQTAKDLEGFLFPATYELKAGDPVSDLVQQQLSAFEDNLAGVNLKDARKVNLTPHDILIIASMVEREAVLDKERPLIASVIYNRLREGIPLGIDATIRFATKNWTDPLTESELQIESPYNTRTNQGLPPGPIGNPGLASIEAAAKPEKTDYLYYVVKPGECGEHAFSETDAQFQQDVERYNSARAAEGGKSPQDC